MMKALQIPREVSVDFFVTAGDCIRSDIDREDMSRAITKVEQLWGMGIGSRCRV